MTTAVARRPLVEVRCDNRLCSFYVRKGHRALVGRISDRAELRCPSCKQVAIYEVG